MRGGKEGERERGREREGGRRERGREGGREREGGSQVPFLLLPLCLKDPEYLYLCTHQQESSLDSDW